MTKILVIDDHEQICNIAEKILRSEGYKVTIARDGFDGLRCFEQIQPDLVITDIFMPNKDGLEVIIELLKRSPNVRIIAMSGMTMPQLEALDIALLFGATSVLEKPFTRKQLLRAVKMALFRKPHEVSNSCSLSPTF